MLIIQRTLRDMYIEENVMDYYVVYSPQWKKNLFFMYVVWKLFVMDEINEFLVNYASNFNYYPFHWPFVTCLYFSYK